MLPDGQHIKGIQMPDLVAFKSILDTRKPIREGKLGFVGRGELGVHVYDPTRIARKNRFVGAIHHGDQGIVADHEEGLLSAAPTSCRWGRGNIAQG